jgi:peptidoglycan/xylan/chitin deacetylase (PgdA/CDA1 family)
MVSEGFSAMQHATTARADKGSDRLPAAMPHPLDTLPRDPWRRRLLLRAESALYWSGAAAAHARLTRASGAFILTYHSITPHGEHRWIDPANAHPASVFSDQMRFLARRRHVISMTELVRTLNAGRTPPRGSVVVTLDDGYLDTLSTAAPIMADHRIPATVYLATGYIDAGEPPWIDTLHAIFRFRTTHEFALPEGGIRHTRLESPKSVAAAYRELVGLLIRADPTARASILNTLRRDLRPAASPPRLTMTWEDVRALRDACPGIEIGVHSVDHVDLSGCDEGEVRRQIEGSIAAVHRELGLRPLHFACPYDRYTPAVGRLAREAGCDSVVGEGAPLLARSGSDSFHLSRFTAPRSRGLFGLVTSGAYPALPRLLFGRD